MDRSSRGVFARLHAGLRAWCRGRNGWVRLPLVAYLGWFLVAHVVDPAYWSWCAPLNLGVHELGHVITRPFGQFIAIAGGSTVQCLLPVIGMGMFAYQRDWFAVPVALAWLGDNLANVSWYCADAQAMELPLVSIGGGDVIHDWNYLLDATGMLDHTALIAGMIRAAGLGCLAVGFAGSAYVVWMMIRPGSAEPAGAAP
jgi:hypothetical protein